MRSHFFSPVIALPFALFAFAVISLKAGEQWGVEEIVLNGPRGGNPYRDVQLSATFRQGDLAITVPGFWDVGSTYKVRFSPPSSGEWRYETKSAAPELNGKTGVLTVTVAGANNHGPVQVFKTFHFRYADGTPYHEFGTTCYAWVHQSRELQEQTLQTLAASPFNKIRFCVFPKSYAYNQNEPEFFAFRKGADGKLDFSRPDPAFWAHFERCILALEKLGIQADIILWHPYDRWGFSEMSDEEDDRYLRYCIARLSAFRNVWWSLANEYDFMTNVPKGHRGNKQWNDWDRFFSILEHEDPHQRLRGIHNGRTWYDHTKAWVTHASLQTSDMEGGVRFRAQYGKPIVYDECKYEGDIPQGWGNLTAREMTQRFWLGTLSGCYVGHGETYKDPQDILWWSKGGVLHGESPKRIQWLKDFLRDAPPFDELKPVGDAKAAFVLAKEGEYYLAYCVSQRPQTVHLAGDRPYKLDMIDPWEMTIGPAGTASPGDSTFSAPKSDLAYRFTLYQPGEKLRPEARIVASVNEGRPPLRVEFTSPAAGRTQWNFGDGNTSQEPKTTHVFEKPGLYTVKLTVTDAEGVSAHAFQSIAVDRDVTEAIVRLGFAEDKDSLPVTMHGTAARADNGSFHLPDGAPWGWVQVAEGPLEDLRSLRSFTLMGWVKPETLQTGSGGNRILFCLKESRSGIDLVCQADGRLRLAVNEWPDSIHNDSSPGKLQVGKWTCFAITYDSTGAGDNVSWYFSAPSDRPTPSAVTLDRKTSYHAGPVDQDVGPLAIGNFNQTMSGYGLDRQFRGAIRGLQIFGSRAGAAGALKPAQINSRLGALGSRADAAILKSKAAKPRVVILSDFPPLDVIPGGAGYGPPEKRSDPDDVQSMVRFLLYANDFDVEGLVASAATFASIANKTNILGMLNLYDQVDENLRRHDPLYPTADQLRAVTWQGRSGTYGKPANEILGDGRDSEASEAIIKLVDRPDPRPVWFCVWGGSSDLAQAIWKVQVTRSPAELERFLSKLRIYLVGKQDGSAQWLLDRFPPLFVILNEKTYFGMFAQNSKLGDLAWINAHVREGHGPLGAAYPRSGFNPNSPGQQEGDSPSFLYLASTVQGLNDPEKPDQESWGGQFVRRDPSKNHWSDGPGPASVAKWLPDIQNDFAARADWMLPVTPGASSTASLKPRIVVLTDISPVTVEPDDFESMIRLLVHADLFEIEGLVATTGWSNSGGSERPDLIYQIIDAYEKDLPNLRKISNQKDHPADESKQQIGYWPSPAYLRSRTVRGSAKMGFDFIGKDNNSDGSALIIKLADEEDARPVWVLVWGGGNTLAQAIWKVQQERTPQQLKSFLKKLRVYTITDQDRPQRGGSYSFSSHYWLRKEFEKDLFFIWDESAWGFQNGTGRANWDAYAEHIQNHGSLGAIYPKYRYGVEGDTPSLLYVWPNGLDDPENPGFAGWGGTFTWGVCRDNSTSAYNNHAGSIAATSRKYERYFYRATFNNFAARMDWARYGTGNRNPVVIVNRETGIAPVTLTPAQGTSVSLDASASHDPDGNKLKFSWWVLPEAGTYTNDITISDANSSRATIDIPSDSAGKSFHVICEVTDDGTPNLTSYRRIIFQPTSPARAK